MKLKTQIFESLECRVHQALDELMNNLRKGENRDEMTSGQDTDLTRCIRHEEMLRESVSEAFQLYRLEQERSPTRRQHNIKRSELMWHQFSTVSMFLGDNPI